MVALMLRSPLLKAADHAHELAGRDLAQLAHAEIGQHTVKLDADLASQARDGTLLSRRDAVGVR
jgi:hypothetical protein